MVTTPYNYKKFLVAYRVTLIPITSIGLQCDFSYSCSAVDMSSIDNERYAVPLLQLWLRVLYVTLAHGPILTIDTSLMRRVCMRKRRGLGFFWGGGYLDVSAPYLAVNPLSISQNAA